MKPKRPSRTRKTAPPRPAKPEGELTPRQETFVREYLVDLNATQAAVRAGYSPRTAQEQASRLLTKVMVQEAIRAAQQARAQRTELDADFVLAGLRAESQLRGFGASHSARVRAFELLGKHLGMFTEKFEHRHGGDAKAPPIRVETHAVEHISDEQRIDRLRSLAARVAGRVAGHDGNGAG